MANEEHKRLAQYLKQVHSELRKCASKYGPDKAWLDHCENHATLTTYAQCMEKLATIHWETNCSSETSEANSRIKWTADFCYDYFVNKNHIRSREKELDVASKMNITLETEEQFSQPMQLLDVGSCYNPFKHYSFFQVLAVDLCPANDTVLQCDFLSVLVGSETIAEDNKIKQIQSGSFDIVTFCYLLEYIPASELRISVCEKAYSLLKLGGLLIINTPDSKHVGANSKLMKCWRYTLANIGFTRIKYEKFKHMHCMAFRKALSKEVAVRWSTLHKEPYMEYAINIPQDYNDDSETKSIERVDINIEDFQELPFFANS